MEREKIVPVYIEEEMKSSYLDYSMSVITARALPDVKDGLKPSNRRILVAMNDLNLAPGRPHRKCAKIAGDTSGNYHPHGEQVVYPTLVRMAQDFNMRYMLVDGQGNFGSIDGDAPAAMRYTEARLAPVAMEMLEDLGKETVGFVPNYDETRQEPTVLPSKFPNLICNGASGIAVGMATNIPTHNLSEVVDALTALIDDPELADEKLLDFIPGPDFPTGGIIQGKGGIVEAYRTGRGRVILKARANVERQKSGKESIIISEIPYQINKSNLLEKIAFLVRDKLVDGISDLRDESDRDGMRIVVELKRDAQAEVVLNRLFKHTQMQATFGVIMLALVDGQPKVLSLKEMLTLFLEHRHKVITRRTQFELKKAEHRAHILEGLKIALDHIDAVIKLIRASKTVDDAKKGLMTKFKLSEIQAQAILDMRLQRLTGLEREKVEQEYLDVIKLIEKLKGILESKAKRMNIIKEELSELKKKYGDERRTEIMEEEEGEFTIEDLIAQEDMVITITHTGYIKRLSVTSYRRQSRGGRGVIGIETKEQDFVEHLFIASTHNYILFFTPKGRCHWIKVHEIPVGGRLAKGKPIVNMLDLEEEEGIAAFVPVREFDDAHFVVMATQSGIIKKTVLSAFSNPRRGGINAMNVPQDDNLIEAKITDGTCDIVLATTEGQAIRFHEDKVRDMGRAAYGVKGITLVKNDRVIGMVVVKRDATLLSVTENGFGKRTSISDYRVTNRGGKGIINIKTTQRNGKVIDIKEVVTDDELMLITQKGIIIRQPVKQITVIGRATQGVKLINLDAGDKVVDVARVVKGEANNNKDQNTVEKES
ncbi:MAG: DNA gyrase subunit A [candidate division Zixibacteria bacterium]|nr:DNA gyrase subunit A [candidate division Zixibacteria bacterium]